MEFEFEKRFKCPYCREQISMLLDLSENGRHQYIEDCEVCCQPIVLEFEIHDHKLSAFTSKGSQ